MSSKNLYDNKSYFKLTSGIRKVYIDEPLDWDKVDFEMPRDADYFGFISEYISDSFSLRFPEDDKKAFNFIKGIYDTEGSDGLINFEFGIYLVNNEIFIPFTGTLNLNKYECESNGATQTITCSIERVSFESLFRTRFETDIDFSSKVNLDNNPIDALPTKIVKLHSRKISKQFESHTTEPRAVSNTDSGKSMARFLSIKFDTSDGQTSELSGNQNLPLSISGLDPRDEALYFFKADEAGDYTINFKASFHLLIQRIKAAGVSNPVVGSYNLVPRLIIQSTGKPDEYITFTNFLIQGNSGMKSIVEFDFVCDVKNINKTLQKNDLLYLDFNGTMGIGGFPYNYFVTNYTSAINIQGKTVAEDTIVNFYRAFDVITKQIEYATGRKNAVKSSVLDNGGEMNKFFLTNGYQIRNFDAANKPFVWSIKGFFEGVFPIKGYGYGIEKINGLEYLVIEPLQYFFQNREITRLYDIYDYKETHASDKVNNQYEIGYNNYPDGDANTLDEFNTYQTGLLPIKTYKATFTKKSDIILSGYSIEIQRREQFSANPSTSLGDDDKIFGVYCIENIKNVSSYFSSNEKLKTITTAKNLALAVNQSFTIVRGSFTHLNDGKTVSIKLIKIESDGSYTYYLNENIGTEVGIGYFSYNIAPDVAEAEADQVFNYVTGILSPESVYNLRLTPRRMLESWMPLLNIGLVKKPDAAVIQCNFVKNNSTLESQIDPLETLLPYDLQNKIIESENLLLSDFRSGIREALHQPLYATFKANMKYDQVVIIREALTGNAQSVNDRGYIVHDDADGIIWKSFVYSFKYSPHEEIAEFQIAKYKIY